MPVFTVVERLARFFLGSSSTEFYTSPLYRVGKFNYINNQILVIRFIELVLTVLSKYNPMYVTLTFTSPLHSYKIQILIHSLGNIIPSSSILGSLFPFVITLSEM